MTYVFEKIVTRIADAGKNPFYNCIMFFSIEILNTRLTPK
jgi:hypothetical protein